MSCHKGKSNQMEYNAVEFGVKPPGESGDALGVSRGKYEDCCSIKGESTAREVGYEDEELAEERLSSGRLCRPTAQASRRALAQMGTEGLDTCRDVPCVDTFLLCRGLHLLHLNIRSLLPKMNEIRLLCKNKKVGLLCFTESGLMTR